MGFERRTPKKIPAKYGEFNPLAGGNCFFKFPRWKTSGLCPQTTVGLPKHFGQKTVPPFGVKIPPKQFETPSKF